MKTDLSVKIISIAILAICISVILLSNYYGSTDIGDYANTAKYFAGEYNADLRSSHSLLYGFLCAPFVFLFKSFLIMKILNLSWLILIILSIYYISNLDRRVLFLSCASPIFWYMGPWISPISLSALLFLWGFFFLTKYSGDNTRYLIYSGLLIGLAAAFWNTVLIILFFLFILFFFDKKLIHAGIFLFSVFLGLSPLLVMDQIIFGFIFFSIVKYFFAVLTVFFYNSIYGGSQRIVYSLLYFLSFILMIPFSTYLLYSKRFFRKNKRTVIFLSISLIFFFISPQIRYLLFLTPLVLINFSKNFSERNFKICLISSIILSLIVILPYSLQIGKSTNSEDLTGLFVNIREIKLFSDKKITLLGDINQIAKDFPNETFVVGNEADDYDVLASIYWGDKINEFVSIQDYNTYLDKSPSLFEKRIDFNPKINYRRKIWIAGGISKSDSDYTNYSSIKYGISLNDSIGLKDFKKIKDYSSLSLFKNG